MVIVPSGVQFGLGVINIDSNHEYDYRQSWKTRSPIINSQIRGKNLDKVTVDWRFIITMAKKPFVKLKVF